MGAGGGGGKRCRQRHCDIKGVAEPRLGCGLVCFLCAMAVNIETRMYVTVENCPSCDWYVSKTISIEGQTYGQVNMNRNDIIRHARRMSDAHSAAAGSAPLGSGCSHCWVSCVLSPVGHQQVYAGSTHQ